MKAETLILEFKKPASPSRSMAILIHNNGAHYVVNVTSTARRFGKCAFQRSRVEALRYLDNIVRRAHERGQTHTTLTKSVNAVVRGQILEFTKALIDGYSAVESEKMEAALENAEAVERGGGAGIVTVDTYDKYLPSKATKELEKFEEKVEKLRGMEVSHTWIDEPVMETLPEKVTPVMVQGIVGDHAALIKARDDAGYGSW